LASATTRALVAALMSGASRNALDTAMADKFNVVASSFSVGISTLLPYLYGFCDKNE
jgi:hypothetical protein